MSDKALTIPQRMDRISATNDLRAWIVAAIESHERLEVEVERLREKVDHLEVLDQGCMYHPTYRARRLPKTSCPDCARMWRERQALVALERESMTDNSMCSPHTPAAYSNAPPEPAITIRELREWIDQHVTVPLENGGFWLRVGKAKGRADLDWGAWRVLQAFLAYLDQREKEAAR